MFHISSKGIYYYFNYAVFRSFGMETNCNSRHCRVELCANCGTQMYCVLRDQCALREIQFYLIIGRGEKIKCAPPKHGHWIWNCKNTLRILFADSVIQMQSRRKLKGFPSAFRALAFTFSSVNENGCAHCSAESFTSFCILFVEREPRCLRCGQSHKVDEYISIVFLFLDASPVSSRRRMNIIVFPCKWYMNAWE